MAHTLSQQRAMQNNTLTALSALLADMQPGPSVARQTLGSAVDCYSIRAAGRKCLQDYLRCDFFDEKYSFWQLCIWEFTHSVVVTIN